MHSTGPSSTPQSRSPHSFSYDNRGCNSRPLGWSLRGLLLFRHCCTHDPIVLFCSSLLTSVLRLDWLKTTFQWYSMDLSIYLCWFSKTIDICHQYGFIQGWGIRESQNWSSAGCCSTSTLSRFIGNLWSHSWHIAVTRCCNHNCQSETLNNGISCYPHAWLYCCCESG